MVAFDVTPTSGAAPYTFTASFTNKESLQSSRYSLEFRAGTESGSCPTGVQSGANQPIVVSSLMDSGTYIQPGSSVPGGSCRVHSLIIRDLEDNSIVDSMNVTIDNV